MFNYLTAQGFSSRLAKELSGSFQMDMTQLSLKLPSNGLKLLLYIAHCLCCVLWISLTHHIALIELGSHHPSVDQVKKMFGEDKFHDHVFYQNCLERYRDAMGIDASEHVSEAPPGLDSELDGKYWRT